MFIQRIDDFEETQKRLPHKKRILANSESRLVPSSSSDSSSSSSNSSSDDEKPPTILKSKRLYTKRLSPSRKQAEKSQSRVPKKRKAAQTETPKSTLKNKDQNPSAKRPRHRTNEGLNQLEKETRPVRTPVRRKPVPEPKTPATVTPRRGRPPAAAKVLVTPKVVKTPVRPAKIDRSVSPAISVSPGRSSRSGRSSPGQSPKPVKKEPVVNTVEIQPVDVLQLLIDNEDVDEGVKNEQETEEVKIDEENEKFLDEKIISDKKDILDEEVILDKNVILDEKVIFDEKVILDKKVTLDEKFTEKEFFDKNKISPNHRAAKVSIERLNPEDVLNEKVENIIDDKVKEEPVKPDEEDKKSRVARRRTIANKIDVKKENIKKQIKPVRRKSIATIQANISVSFSILLVRGLRNIFFNLNKLIWFLKSKKE